LYSLFLEKEILNRKTLNSFLSAKYLDLAVSIKLYALLYPVP
jgi:hypothetical protein